jgi:hemerythrin-like domain-containing protein
LIQIKGGRHAAWPDRAMQRAIEIMHDRQRAMSSTLLAVRTIARRSLKAGTPPDFSQLRRLVAYHERFPQRRHHPAEEEHLFRAVLRRDPGAERAIKRAKRDHAACAGYVERLRTALAYWERGDPKAGSEVALQADDYARFCRLHARIETRDVLSVAVKVLSDQDWLAIERAYAATDDPLARSRSRAECAAALGTIGDH